MAKYDGLLYIPATDGNFVSGIQRLKNLELGAMFEKLTELEESEGGHKGRIKAVKKELESRSETSGEMRAVAMMADDINVAEELYSDGMPYELERLENEIRFYQDQAGTALLEMGKRFIRIKAHEDHGRFMRSIENVGMTDRSVRYAMAAARKFSDRKSISDLGSTKMIALSVLDDDEVEKLDSGGAIAGMKLDDIDRMTVRELRENLRKEKEAVKKEKETRKNEREAFKKSMIQKDEKINELDMKMSGMEPPTKEQIAAKGLEDLNGEYSFALAEVNCAIRNALFLVQKAESIPNVNVQQLSEWLNQFDGEMRTFLEVHDRWTDEVDNPGPIVHWRIGDLPGGEDSDVSSVG